MNKLLLLPLVAALSFTISSCNFYKRLSGKKQSVSASDSAMFTIHSPAPLGPDTMDRRADTLAAVSTVQSDPAAAALLRNLTPVWNAQTVWSTFSGKAKMHYEGKGESHDFTATIRMEAGRRIWVSVVALGLFEAARVLITPDTIQIMDRVHKEIKVLPFSDAGKVLPLPADFAALQTLIVGDAIKTGHQPTDVSDTAMAFILTYISPDFSQSLQLDKADTSIRFQAVSAQGVFMLSEHAGYAMEGGRRFARNRNISVSDKGELSALSLEFSKADFDGTVEMPFSIPEKYELK